MGVLFLCSAWSAHAAGVGVRPSTLSASGRIGEPAKVEVLVMNTGDEPAVYSLQADTAADRVTFVPSAFSLDPQGSQVVLVTARPKSGSETILLSVVARPLGATVAAAGVKVPLVLSGTGFSAAQLVGIIAVLVVALGGVVGIALHWRKRKNII
jgi:hypothetical protein